MEKFASGCRKRIIQIIKRVNRHERAGEMMKLGFIGLGEMGKPMAMNLLKCGEPLIVCDMNDSHFSEFENKGAKTTKDPRELVDSDIVFSCLPNSEVIETVFHGDQGLLNLMKSDSILVDFSTIKYSTAVDLGNRCQEKGIRFLDAPISGMLSRAIDGSLVIMCGGNEETFNAMVPLLQYMGKNILYMGPAGSGQLMKLINNLLFDINAAAIAEILPMSKYMGLDPENVVQVINDGTGRSYASEFFAPKILQGDFDKGYPMEKAYKDLVSGNEISAEKGIPLPVLAAATATYQMALRAGYGKLGKGGMIRVYEKILGVEFRGAEAEGKE